MALQHVGRYAAPRGGEAFGRYTPEALRAARRHFLLFGAAAATLTVGFSAYAFVTRVPGAWVAVAVAAAFAAALGAAAWRPAAVSRRPVLGTVIGMMAGVAGVGVLAVAPGPFLAGAFMPFWGVAFALPVTTQRGFAAVAAVNVAAAAAAGWALVTVPSPTVGADADAALRVATLTLATLVAAMVVLSYRTHAETVLREAASTRAVIAEANGSLRNARRARAQALLSSARAVRGAMERLLTRFPAPTGGAQPDTRSRATLAVRRNAERLLVIADRATYALGLVYRPIRKANVDAAAAVAVAVERAGAHAERRGLRIATHAERNLLTTGDQDRFVAALTELIENAVRVTPRGGVVSVKARHEAGNVVITVADMGPGLPAEAGDDLFEPFGALAASNVGQESSRTGVGLHVARGVVSSMGGQVTLETNPNGGAVATVRVPEARPRFRATAVSRFAAAVTRRPDAALLTLAVVLFGVGSARIAVGYTTGTLPASLRGAVSLAIAAGFAVLFMVARSGHTNVAGIAGIVLVVAGVAAYVGVDPTTYVPFVLVPVLGLVLLVPLLRGHVLFLAGALAVAGVGVLTVIGETATHPLGGPLPLLAQPVFASGLVATLVAGIAFLAVTHRALHDNIEGARAARDDEAALLATLSSLDEQQARLVNGAAHAFATPLTPILTNLHLLASGRAGDLTPHEAALVQASRNDVEELRSLTVAAWSTDTAATA